MNKKIGLIETIANYYGFEKGVRARQIASAEHEQTQSLVSAFGDPIQKNFDKFLKGYADHVWVYACVFTIANTIASLPFRVFKVTQTRDGAVKREITSGAVIDLIRRPSIDDPNMTWYNLIEFTMASLELAGNAYWLHEGEQIPTELIPLIASRVQALPGKERFIDGYRYVIPGKSQAIDPYKPEIISHFKYMNPAGNIYGIPSLAPGRFSVDNFSSMLQTNMNIFKNGALTDIFLKTDRSLSDKAYNRLLHFFKKRHVGLKKAHKPGVLEEGLDIKEIRKNLRELEYIKGNMITREEICAAFGVPPLLVGILDKATYSNYKESVKVLYNLSIIPKINRIQPIINNTVISKFGSDLVGEFDLSEVEALKEDEKEKSEIAKNFFSMGVPMKQINAKLKLNFTEFIGWDKSWLPINLIEAGTTAEEGDPGADDDDDKSKDVDMSNEIPYIKMFGKEWKREKWIKFVKLGQRIEKAYMKLIDQFFTKERNAMLRGLKAASGQPLTETRIEKLLDDNLAIKGWSNENTKFHRLALNETAKQEVNLLNQKEISFDIANPAVRKWLSGYALSRSTLVHKTLKTTLKKEILAGVDASESVAQISRRIVSVYEPYKQERFKANRIARTEILAASNQGALEVYDQNEEIEGKGWINEPDARDSHQAAGNKYDEKGTIPKKDKFILAGGSGPAPGQIGTAEEDVNCRCTIFAKLRKKR
ncbi:hypothetical protein LCGC14_0764700 [marine sediment metagenome]|uniref:Phage head morphogenesis domain-containing protein n=1 Tax=marine sediment metagenome TaxID=412755 RepID=A0A0F9QJY9_9ZZZZ